MLVGQLCLIYYVFPNQLHLLELHLFALSSVKKVPFLILFIVQYFITWNIITFAFNKVPYAAIGHLFQIPQCPNNAA